LKSGSTQATRFVVAQEGLEARQAKDRWQKGKRAAKINLKSLKGLGERARVLKLERSQNRRKLVGQEKAVVWEHKKRVLGEAARLTGF